MSRVSIFLAGGLSACLAAAQLPEPPKPADDTLGVSLFAAEPMLRNPVGCTIDRSGRLLVIESNTHFRPHQWDGPQHDQVVSLLDSDGDGRADRREVFFDQTDMTMDIATHPDGSIYLATRNEILRLRDTDGDGKADKIERKLVWLESPGRYPHDGLSGLAFDAAGDLFFGMGENLGAPYVLTASDGSSHRDEGEGGNIWKVTRDGGQLTRIATGFWNPFGVCIGPQDQVFATDNDPDSSPPCRLLHVVRGGDFGYQFRYGRSGLHPFVSWNGQRLGTLPMVAATGEAPCDIIRYRRRPHAAWRGLGEQWDDTLLVASWSDHRVESYRLVPGKGTFSSQCRVLVQGGPDFRPVAFAVTADGSVFVTDWVKRDYELHGFGRVWKISARTPSEVKDVNPPRLAVDPDAAIRTQLESGPTPQADAIRSCVARPEAPYLFAAAVERMSREPALLRELAESSAPDPRLRAAVLLATRHRCEREPAARDQPGAELNALLARALADPDPAVVLLGLHWVSDARMEAGKAAVEKVLANPGLTSKLFFAALTTLARLEEKSVGEGDLVGRLRTIIANPGSDAARVRMAAEIMPDREQFLTPAELRGLIRGREPVLAAWVTDLLGIVRAPGSDEELAKLARDTGLPAAVRAAALRHATMIANDLPVLEEALVGDDAEFRRAALVAFTGLPLPPKIVAKLGTLAEPTLAPMAKRLQGEPFFTGKRPEFTDVAGWRAYLRQVPGKPDATRGREVFLSDRLGGCATCHTKDGLGTPAGPNLDQVQAAGGPDYVLTSVLQPNANVSPQFECFVLTTNDGKTRTAFQLNERGGTHTYIDLAGKIVTLPVDQIINRVRLPVSVMPEGILSRLTDSEARDLFFYLEGAR